MQKCSHCGKENPEAAIQCYGCGNEFDDNLPPVTKLTQAGFRIRALARIIDFVFCFALGYFAGMVGGLVLHILAYTGAVDLAWYQHIPRFSPIFYCFAGLAHLSYRCCCEGLHGATLGKYLCRICVVQLDGTPCNVRGALVRSIVYIWDCQFFGAIGYYGSMEKSPLNQRYGDVLAKTVVLRNSEIAPDNAMSNRNFILGLLLGTINFVAWVVLGLVLTVYYQV